jgi:hypothetical protein
VDGDHAAPQEKRDVPMLTAIAYAALFHIAAALAWAMFDGL